jgi:hypothetical protein
VANPFSSTALDMGEEIHAILTKKGIIDASKKMIEQKHDSITYYGDFSSWLNIPPVILIN